MLWLLGSSRLGRKKHFFFACWQDIKWVSLTKWHLCVYVSLSCRNLAKSVCCYFYYLLGYHIPIDVCTCTSCLLTVKWYHCFLFTNSFHYYWLSGAWWKVYWYYTWTFLAWNLHVLKQNWSTFKPCCTMLLTQRNLCLTKLQLSWGERKDLAKQYLKPISLITVIYSFFICSHEFRNQT